MSRNICKFPTPSFPDTLSVSCFVSETDPVSMSNESRLSRNRMILVTRGKGSFSFDGIPTEGRTGNLIFGLEGETFRACGDEELSYMYIDFSGLRAEELIRRFDLCSANRCYDGFDHLIPLWSESLSRCSEDTVDLATESMLLYTFSRFCPDRSARSMLLRRIVELTDDRFCDPTTSISEIAEALSYNPKYLSHLFKEKMGVTYSEYLRTLRIRYAVSLFDHGLDSVKNVALLSGFPDPLYFSGVFKKQVGQTPTDYIRSRSKT